MKQRMCAVAYILNLEFCQITVNAFAYISFLNADVDYNCFSHNIITG